MPPEASGTNYTQFAAELDEVRENLRAIDAGFVADGITDREARELVVAIFKKGAES